MTPSFEREAELIDIDRTAYALAQKFHTKAHAAFNILIEQEGYLLVKELKTRGLVFILLALGAALLVAFDPPPSVDAVTMTRTVDAGFKATSPTTTFSTNDAKVYASVTVSNFVVGTTLASKWYLNGTEVPGAASSITMNQAGSGYVAFSASFNSGSIPAGNWTVEIYRDGDLVNTTPFTVLTASAPASSAPSVDSVTMTSDVDSGFKATSPTTTFSTTDAKIYASVAVSNFVVGTTVSSKWYVNGTEAPSAASSITINQAGSGYVAFSVTFNNGSILAGNWTVEIYLDGNLAKTTPFTVQ